MLAGTSHDLNRGKVREAGKSTEMNQDARRSGRAMIVGDSRCTVITGWTGSLQN